MSQNMHDGTHAVQRNDSNNPENIIPMDESHVPSSRPQRNRRRPDRYGDTREYYGSP